ncbi:MAG: glycosyltransferase family 2 protein, partial [Clostridiales bacterium]|nr:glycosyltransferase family 2 protein [Clostridiales bacterium]
MKKVTLVVPCYNEADVLELLYNEVTAVFKNLTEYELELLLVDDGSKDETLNIIKSLAAKDDKVKFISFSRNFGKEAAMLAGLKNADGEYIGIIDADLQHSPDLLPPMLEALEKEGYDVAAARRTDRAGEAKLKSTLSESFY